MVFVIGLTGGICSGKTTITKFLQEQEDVRPLYIINADLVGHQAYQMNTPAYLQLLDTFGRENILNHETMEIDRAKLGSIVFKDPKEMKKLTDIVWPEIRRLVTEQIETYDQEEKTNHSKCVVVLEAAVLFEAKWTDLCHSIWLITSKLEDVTQRLLQRNPHLSLEQAQQRIQSQMTNLEEKRQGAHHILENNQDLSLPQLQEQVRSLLLEVTSAYRERK